MKLTVLFLVLVLVGCDNKKEPDLAVNVMVYNQEQVERIVEQKIRPLEAENVVLRSDIAKLQQEVAQLKQKN